MKSRLRDAIVDRMDRNETIATRYLNDQEFESVTSRELLRRIYEELRTKAAKDEMSG